MHVPVTVSIDGIKEKKTQILILLTFKDELTIQKNSLKTNLDSVNLQN